MIGKNWRVLEKPITAISQEDELKALVGGNMDTRDTNMDTYPQTALKKGQAAEA
jgi:hypothetical protein